MRTMLTILGALLAVVAISIALRDKPFGIERVWTCLLYTSDAADEL